MRTRILLALLLQAPLFLLAQTNYMAAAVVTANGDTLHGFINYKEWRHNPDKISFKQQLNDIDAQSFTPGNATWFVINGYESYAAFTVAISVNETSFGSLKEQADTTTITKTVFLKEILKGDRLNLYAYTDAIKERFFILDKRQAVPRELLYRKTLKDMEERTDAVYQQQLTALAIDLNHFTTRLNQLIQRAPYTKDRLKNIVSHMNTTNEPVATQMLDRKRRADFFVGAGYNKNQVTYTGENLITIDRVDDQGRNKYRKSVQTNAFLPRYAAWANFYTNPAVRRFFIRTEIAATQVKSSTRSYYKYSNYSPDENEYSYQLSAWSFSFVPQVVYNVYNTIGLKWYIGLGGSFNYMKAQENTLVQKDYDATMQKREDYFPLRPFNMNTILTSGVLVKQRINVNVTWGNPVEYTDYASGNTSVKSGLLALTAAYSLRK